MVENICELQQASEIILKWFYFRCNRDTKYEKTRTHLLTIDAFSHSSAWQQCIGFQTTARCMGYVFFFHKTARLSDHGNTSRVRRWGRRDW